MVVDLRRILTSERGNRAAISLLSGCALALDILFDLFKIIERESERERQIQNILINVYINVCNIVPTKPFKPIYY